MTNQAENTMSAATDKGVLAADEGPIACAELYLRLNSDGDDILADGLRDARAAVAELVEAVADVYLESDIAPCEGSCPTCRIRAALARCGSAQ